MNLPPQTIIEKVSAYYEKDQQVLNLKSRKQEFVKVRQVTFKFLRDYTKLSLAEIGRFYDKDHATVLHSIKHVNNLCDTEKGFKQEVDELKYILIRHDPTVSYHKFRTSNIASFHYNVMSAFGNVRIRNKKGQFIANN